MFISTLGNCVSKSDNANYAYTTQITTHGLVYYIIAIEYLSIKHPQFYRLHEVDFNLNYKIVDSEVNYTDTGLYNYRLVSDNYLAVYNFIATKKEGDLIANEINRRLIINNEPALIINVTKVLVANFNTYFN